MKKKLKAEIERNLERQVRKLMQLELILHPFMVTVKSGEVYEVDLFDVEVTAHMDLDYADIK